MTNRFAYLLSLIMVTSCDSVQLEPGTSSTEKVGEKPSTLESAKTTEPKPTDPKPGSESVIPPLASLPIAVGGGFLTCVRSAAKTQAKCDVKNDAGNYIARDTRAVYTISGSPAVWSPVTFRINPVHIGSITVDIPNFNGSFAIASVDQTNSALINWVSSSSADNLTLVGDGGFESTIVTGPDYYQYFLSSASKNWIIRRAANNVCPDATPVFELLRSDGGVNLPAAGKQWMELDGECLTAVDKGGNVGIHQIVGTKIGHLYTIAFSYRKRVLDMSTKLQRFRAKIDDVILLERDTTNVEWVRFEKTITATSASLRLDFEELGFSDHWGTQLDEVTLYDNGLGPDAPTP